VTRLASSDIFQSIEIGAAQVGVPEMELFGVRLAEVRTRLGMRHGDVFDTNGWWQGLIEESRRKPDPWRLATVWVVMPRLRSMAWKVHFDTGLELNECRSELILGALEAVGNVMLDAEDIGEAFTTLAARSAWALGRSHTKSLAEMGWDGDELLSMPAELPLLPEKFKRIIDARQYLLTPKQLAGERFGALAAKLGMLELLSRPGPEAYRMSNGSAPLNFMKLFRPPQFIDLKTVADVIGISMNTAYQRVKLRKFRFAVFKEGRSYQIPTTSLASSMGIYMDEIDFDDVLSGAHFAAQYYEPPDEGNPFAER
jgi:hypothetical protein